MLAERSRLITMGDEALKAVAEPPPGSESFGPRPLSGESTDSAWVLAAPAGHASALAHGLHQALGRLTVRKQRAPRVQVDPADLVL